MRISLAPHRAWQVLFCWAAMLVCTSAGYLWSDEPHAHHAHHAHPPAKDPVALNGPIFVDWPQPQVALLFSGEMDGYIEPCGCAGLENQKGGLKRRHTLIQQLEAKGWPLVSLDMGGEIRRFGPQAEIKYRYVLEALQKLGYAAVGFGSKELQLDANYLAYVLSNFDPAANPVVSSNVAVIDFDIGLTKRFRVIEAGGKRIGVATVLGRKHQPSLQNAKDIVWTAPADALRKVLPELERAKCDLHVLLVNADPDEARALAKQFPQFQLVGTTGGAEEPPNHAQKIEGTDAQLIEVGHKGMYVAVVGIYDDPEHRFRFQRVPLDHRFKDSKAMQAVMVAYQKELQDVGLEALVPTDEKHPEGRFIGSALCGDCHTQAAEVFQATPHAQATDTLVHLDPPRHFDPECLSCHTTGWNPQEYFPYVSGYLGLQKTPEMVGNGCENCHGPGAAHVAAESGDEAVSDVELELRRTAMRLRILENEGNQEGQTLGPVVKKCLECHDLDNSPDFDFQKYWPHVEHQGKD